MSMMGQRLECENASRAGDARRPEPLWLRRAEIIVYVFLGTCITSGLIYLYPAACAGQVRDALIGAAITIGGSGAALIMLAVVRIGSLTVYTAERLDEIGQRMDALEDTLEAALSSVPDENASASRAAPVDLAAIGRGAPGLLVAATVPDHPFPRLAGRDEEDLVPADAAVPRERTVAGPVGPPTGPEARWQRAFDEGDLLACRRILAEAGSLIPPERRQAMLAALDVLIEDRKQALRDEFSALVRSRRFADAIAKGREITQNFPNSAMAAEFEQVEPYLARRAAEDPPRSARGQGR
jgi:hypothetical protein